MAPRQTNLRWRALLLGTIVAAGLAGGIYRINAVSASSDTQLAGKTDYIRHSTANTNLGSTPGAYTTILSVTVPAGSWVVTANGTVVNSNTVEIVRCAVYNGATQLGQTASMPDVSASYVLNQSAIGAFTSTTAAIVTMKCEGDNGGSSYIDSGATLLVHRSGGLG